MKEYDTIDYVEHENMNTAEYWDKIHSGELTEWRLYPKTVQLVRNYVENTESKYITEWGCGTGILAVALLEQIPTLHYIGFDISFEAAKRANKKLLDKNGIVYDLSLNDTFQYECICRHADVVIACEFLEHFQSADWCISQLCRYGKRVCLVVPDSALPPAQCKEHYQCFDKWELQEKMERFCTNVKVVQFVDHWKTTNASFMIPLLMVTGDVK